MAPPKFIYAVTTVLCSLAILAVSVIPVPAAEKAPVFSHGAGPYELIIFSDYFCAPCQKMEKELDETISAMLEKGKVRITFVDVPLYKLTPLYGTYFLYVLNAAPGYKEALRARRLLFEKASRIGAIEDKHLEDAFRAENIPFRPYNIQQSLNKYNDLIKKHKVRSTPTFVFIYSPHDIRKCSKSDAIRKEMAKLANMLENREKNSCSSCNSVDFPRY